MAVIQRVVKPTTRKGKKVLLSREPKVIEGPKQAVFLKGRKTTDRIRNALTDLYALKKPDATMLAKKNDITIFENVTPVERFCKKYDSAMFVMGSDSKKRPDNLVIGRMFDHFLLDMIELGIDSFDGLQKFCTSKITLGTKPCLVFNGPLWEQSDDLKQLKSIFVDMFNREYVESVRLQGIEHALSFTAIDSGKILLRSYKILLKKSGNRTPRIETEEIGPRLDFTLRRTKLPTEDLMKQACKKPKELKIVTKKNISRDGLGNVHGRIHLGKQNIRKITTRKMKGLRKTPGDRRAQRNKTNVTNRKSRANN